MSRYRHVVAPLLALLVVTTWFARAAWPAESSEVTWRARYDWLLEIDGKPSYDARFFVEQDGQRVLIHVPELTQVALLKISGKKVATLDASEMQIAEDGTTAKLSPGAAEAAPETAYNLDGSRVIFYVGNRRLKLSPKLPLEGTVKLEEILHHSPLYKKGMEEYTPQQSDINLLRHQASDVQIEVFFGTWCPHCKVMVPRFMKSIQTAGNPKLHVSYVGVPRRFVSYARARAKGVRQVPTFIFYRNGREVGRIAGEPAEGTIEHAMAELLGRDAL